MGRPPGRPAVIRITKEELEELDVSEGEDLIGATITMKSETEVQWTAFVFEMSLNEMWLNNDYLQSPYKKPYLSLASRRAFGIDPVTGRRRDPQDAESTTTARGTYASSLGAAYSESQAKLREETRARRALEIRYVRLQDLRLPTSTVLTVLHLVSVSLKYKQFKSLK